MSIGEYTQCVKRQTDSYRHTDARTATGTQTRAHKQQTSNFDTDAHTQRVTDSHT